MHVLVQHVGRKRRVRAQDAHVDDSAPPFFQVAAQQRAQHPHETGDRGVRELGHAAVIDERHAAVIEQDVVARVRVTVEQAMPVDRPEAVTEHDLGDAVPRGLVGLVKRRERPASDELLDQYVRRRQLVHDFWHADERVAPEMAGEPFLRRRLSQVIQLAEQPLLQIADDRPWLDTRRHRANERHHQLDVREIVLDRLPHAGVLHLHGHVLAVQQRRAVHLPDGGCGERHALERPEDLLRRPPEVALEHVLDQVVRHRRRVSLQRCQLGSHVFRQHAAHKRQDLPELHDRALHVAHRLGDIAGRLHHELAALLRARLAPRELRTHPPERRPAGEVGRHECAG